MKKINYCEANAIAGGTISSEHLLLTILGAVAVSALAIMSDRLVMQNLNEAPYRASWSSGYS
jgi:hypothetical protein